MRGNHIFALTLTALGCSDASLKTFNAEPVAVITSHADGEELLEQEETVFRGSASDPDHDEVDLLTTWRVNGDVICADVVPERDGSTTCVTTLATGAVTVVLEVSDPKSAADSDSVSFTVTPNTPPNVSLTDPFDGERYYADEAIEFKGRVTDEEDAFDHLVVSVESDIQGPLDLNTALSGDGRFSDFGNLEAGTHIITVTAIDSGGEAGRDQEEVEVLPGNSAPTIASVEISPNPATVTDMLSCIISGYEDADGDADQSQFEWTVNGAVAGSSETLSDAFVAGDEVVCTVTPSDGEDDGTPISDSITISNSVPQIEAVDIAPDVGVRASSVIICTAVAEDDDGDVPVITYAWDIGGVAAGGGDTLDLADTAVVTGDVVTCTATATDLAGDIDTGTDSVVIENTAPEVDGLTLSPEPVYTNDTLVAAVSASDVEGDAVSIVFEWYVNDVMVAYGTDNTLSGLSHFGRDDEVYVVATPSDAMDDGEPLRSATLIVSNTPPTEPTVSIEAGCEEGWTEMPDGIRCAKAFDTSTDWRGSQANCESQGGTLVRISDETDNDFVVDLYSATGAGSVWFHAGMTDEAEEGTWVWLDGVDSAYRNWDPGQPDWEHEDCLEVVAGGWGNTTCDDTSYTGHVCQTEYGAGLTCIIDDESTDVDGDAVDYTFVWDFDGDAYTDTVSRTYDGDTVPRDALSADGVWTCTVTPDDGEEDGPAGSAYYDFFLPEPAECTSLYFDGDDDMQVPASMDFVEFREGLTIEAWVRWDGYEGDDWYPIATLGWGGDGSLARFFLAISGAEESACSGLGGPGYLHFEVQTRPSLGACISSSTELVAETWHHVAAVFDAGEARIYIDGELEGAAFTPDDLLRDVGPSVLKIGRVDAGAGSRFLGSMSNVRYSSAAQYEGSFAPEWPLEAHSETVGLWPLDEEGGWDVSGNEHHGAVSGGTWVEECPGILDGG